MGREVWKGNGGRDLGEEDGGHGNGRWYRDRWQLGQGPENKE